MLHITWWYIEMICWWVSPHIYSVSYIATIKYRSRVESCTCFVTHHYKQGQQGFGVQLAFDGVQVDLILPAGTKLSLHLKKIWAPPTVVMLWKFSMMPFSGAWGIPQLTEGRRKRMVWRYTETEEVDWTSPCPKHSTNAKYFTKIKLFTMQVYICKRKHVKDYTKWFSLIQKVHTNLLPNFITSSSIMPNLYDIHIAQLWTWSSAHSKLCLRYYVADCTNIYNNNSSEVVPHKISATL